MSIDAKTFLSKVGKRPLTFGRLLASLRKADGITQSKLAKTLNISKGLICDIEKGRRAASVELAAKIAKAMGYPKEVMIIQVFQDRLHDAKIKLKVTLKAA